MDGIASLGSWIRPQHVILDDSSSTLSRPMRMIGQFMNDPWYRADDSRHQRHRSMESENSSTTRFDVRESKSFWFLEGEFPGIADKESIHIEYIGSRTLLIEAHVERVDERVEWGNILGEEEFGDYDLVSPREHSRRHGHEHGEVMGRRREKGVRESLNERHFGLVQRSFTFPQDVDLDRVKARLESGLLKVLVPKVVSEQREPTRRIPIE